MIWRRIHTDQGDWEVRVFAVEPDRDHYREEILEFTPVEATRPPRRLAIGRANLDEFDDEALASCFRQARPIAGDYYGRPGKRMADVPLDRPLFRTEM